MTHMKFGEISPGGVGVGLMGILINALLAVFIAGLMVGRTPEYLGKKIQAPEMKLVTLYILAMPFAVLTFAAASVLLKSAATYQGGRPRPVGGAVQLRLERQQQRLGVRLPGHRHAVVHDHPGHLDADGSVLHDHPGARHRRLAGRQAEGAGDERHDADAHAAVRRARRRRHLHRRRPDVLPGAGAGPDPRTPVHCEDSRHHDRNHLTPIDQRPPKVRTKESATKSIFDPGDRHDGDRRFDQEAQPAHDDAQPGDVHRRGRLGADDDPVHPRLRRQRLQAEPVRRSRCRRGCGSPCCSPTSPRRWQRAAARPRPTRCARPAPTRPREFAAPTGSITREVVVAARARRSVRRDAPAR